MTTTDLPDFAPMERLGITVEQDRPLAPLTSMKVGGPAQYFATVTRSGQLLELVRWARRVGLPYLVLGGGSNVLIGDAGVRGLVIHNRCQAVHLEQLPCREHPQDERPCLCAESGALMAGVARYSVREELAGLEWAVSVPGTVGGAVVNNAGAHGSEIKDCLVDALVLDCNDNVKEYRVAELHYGYRRSALKQPGAWGPLRAGFAAVVLSASFRLSHGDPAAIKVRADGYLQHRRRTQPVEASLGSTFVNPPGDYAGRLIEAAGLKGRRIGGVEVSRTHANFLINPGGVGSATASDVLALMEHIQERVWALYGVELKPEIQLVGEWPSVRATTDARR